MSIALSLILIQIDIANWLGSELVTSSGVVVFPCRTISALDSLVDVDER